ncbi:hypothetical protein [Parasediminibacterium sp. JCM 36343]|uniref:hypothetical protein n=1 Tax=Parasediminibacterium sp. JCM 36343 TaxID=3374279 RepID=UPI003978840D
MKKWLIGFWYSLPIQLFFLHFRKHQVFLLFWYILFATIAGHFLNTYGAVALFLSPEYLGEVNFFSTAIVGMCVGVFIMSWNITTFILHAHYLKFLATTAQPFLKYCINNAIIPLIFLIFYFIKAIPYEHKEEYNNWLQISGLVLGFLVGFSLAILIAFLYFFTADKSIYYSMAQMITVANKQYDEELISKPLPAHKDEFRVDWFLSAAFSLRKPRDTRHYSEEFLDSLAQRHHFAAVYAILVAFIFLVVVGFFSDKAFFQLPAAASIAILFAILIGVSGAFSLFLKSWSIPVVVCIYIIFNYLYVNEIFDPRNKVYGLHYPPKKERAVYSPHTIDSIASYANMEEDRQHFLQVLNNWKQRQHTDKPTVFIINVSGGGSRSAAFAMDALQRIDSLLHGRLMPQTILINGASGGMLGAAYYRELYLQKIKGNKNINLQNPEYASNISKDLLNPLFSSFVSRDMLGPVQKISLNGNDYVKDRGYAFEQQLNKNTDGILIKQLKSYTYLEEQGIVPVMIFNPVVSRDGKKMIISTQPFRFLMKPPIDSARRAAYEADAIDFNRFFAGQSAMDISMLSALRMNATFPYVLPNVWLPSNPIIDVIDAGLRDNYGQETSLRLIEACKSWFQANTANLVLIQIRDTPINDWNQPQESNTILSFFTNPLLFLQNNWFSIQDYYQHDQLEHLYESYGSGFKKICFQYIPGKDAKPAGLSFHLTSAEKKDIAASLKDSANIAAMQQLQQIVQH